MLGKYFMIIVFVQNVINQKQLKTFIEDTAQQTQEFLATVSQLINKLSFCLRLFLYIMSVSSTIGALFLKRLTLNTSIFTHKKCP